MRSIFFPLGRFIASILAPVESPAGIQHHECNSDVRPAVVPVFRDLLAKGSVLRLRLQVAGGPSFPGGREIFTVRKVPAKSIRFGDLIFLEPMPGAAILQRVIAKTSFEDGIWLRTLGEAATGQGFCVNWERLLGKVLAVEAGEADGPLRFIDLESLRWRLFGYCQALRLLWAVHLGRQTSEHAGSERTVVGKPVPDAARESA